MNLNLSERFLRDANALPKEIWPTLWETLMILPSAMKDSHRHSGLGLRKIHRSGIFEIRIGLRLRAIFGYREGTIYLNRLGTHDDVQRYLRTL